MIKTNFITKLIICILFSSILGGCMIPQKTTVYQNTTEKTVAKYQDIGRYWGNQLKMEKYKPNDINDKFVKALIMKESIDYFKVHAELKDAFKKGFREGFEDRIADLVLGPHITRAAGHFGQYTAENFVKVTEDFEKGWGDTLQEAVDVFIVLIAEGSQADRTTFSNQFVDTYDKKYKETKKIIESDKNYIRQISEGGTVLLVNKLGALDITNTSDLRAEIYSQAFTAMGDEWGKRFSTNLIKRDDLVDVIRRSKQALSEVEVDGKISDVKNFAFIQNAFIKSYGDGAEDIINSLSKDAGYGDQFSVNVKKSKS